MVFPIEAIPELPEEAASAVASALKNSQRSQVKGADGGRLADQRDVRISAESSFSRWSFVLEHRNKKKMSYFFKIQSH